MMDVHKLVVRMDARGRGVVELDGHPLRCHTLHLHAEAGRLTEAQVDLICETDVEVDAEIQVGADAIGPHRVQITSVRGSAGAEP